MPGGIEVGRGGSGDNQAGMRGVWKQRRGCCVAAGRAAVDKSWGNELSMW